METFPKPHLIAGKSFNLRLIASKQKNSSRGAVPHGGTPEGYPNRVAVFSHITNVCAIGTLGTLVALSIAAASIALYPAETKASVFDWISSGWENTAQAMSISGKSVQSMTLPKPAMNIDPNPAKGGGDVTIVDGSALVSEEGPAGTIADIQKPKSTQIAIYVVREGDTLSGIAHMYGVTANTIKWANDIPPSGTIRIGQTLTILPVSGVPYTVQKGDTVASIAKQFKGDADEIVNYNGLEGDLAVGTKIIIPDGEIAAPVVASAPKSTARSGGSSSVLEPATYSHSSEYSGYYIAPLASYKRTQGIHGYNGVDLAAPAGSPILASATGDVIVAKDNGAYNGGYGNYIVIQHNNGTQTLYAHASSVIVGIGQHVVQGQVIGYEGKTGKATGYHVHFEIRGGPSNPF